MLRFLSAMAAPKLATGQTVAIIGAGPTGLSMLKTLREDGFDTTILERRSRVGGLWSYTEDESMTTALPSTIANISKYTCGFTDYPMPDHYPPFLNQIEFQEFLESYSTHFGLQHHISFRTSATKVERNADDTKWRVEMVRDGSPETREFDKVVCCHGYQTQAKSPKFKGQDGFQGRIMHAQQFRRPEDFKGQNVVFVGMSSTASDIVPIVVPHAAKVYISHRRGTWIFGRWRNGLPTDLLVSYARRRMGYIMQSWFPNLSAKLSKLGTRFLMKKYGELDPAWRLSEDAPALSLALTACMDVMLDLLREGKITSVHGVESFPGGKKVKFADGTVLDDIDTVVLCTGYRADFSILPFVQHSSPEADVNGNPYGGAQIPRLYMNMFPPKYADSMAVLIASTYGKNNGFSFADVISMAISNIWRGVSADMIPPAPEMDRAIDAHQKWIAGRWTIENTTDPVAVKQWEFQGFLHDAAGTGLAENLGWGWKGWWTWLKDPKMSYLMRNGVETAYAFRYFETGKRATWPGAREAIIHTNDAVKKLKAEGSPESAKKK
ncbi:dimethylaniline monooxygenase 2 [Thelonectria olida]|uniref:Dimethylaniline monooxygenase 2 n=1 Tax=Thelonectria olida TaxID=1576542 RepID=A0A9P9AUR7_9HYPO|nr:dimethylaniline monooxygenase 2 [Thelonectria olida]